MGRTTLGNHDYQVTMDGDEPAIIQKSINGWAMSWNPDDNLFYVELPSGPEKGRAAARFKDWRNAVYYAKKHTIPA